MGILNVAMSAASIGTMFATSKAAFARTSFVHADYDLLFDCVEVSEWIRNLPRPVDAPHVRRKKKAA